jgi:2-(1,2-epoxy-1,2-dihydrophenyl)acetyl-CoA isomerase
MKTGTNPTQDEKVLLEENHGNVRLLKLNRPAKKNALSNELSASLVSAIDRAMQDSTVRVIGLTGVGDTFCAGADLSPAKNRQRGADTIDTVVQLITGIRVRCEKPVIAGINGLAIGAGVSLAMCCDMRMASSNASFHPGYARAGTSPDCGLTWTLPQAVGHEQAMRFLLELEFIDAQQALTRGLIGEVVPADTFEQAFEAYCQKIAGVAPLAARQTKLQIAKVGLPDDLEALIREELRYTGRGLKSDDGKEAVRAIFEKRKPVFGGS